MSKVTVTFLRNPGTQEKLLPGFLLCVYAINKTLILEKVNYSTGISW